MKDCETGVSKYRDEQRLRLRNEGVKRGDAAEQAWELMAREYPPPLPEPDIDDVADFCAMGQFPPPTPKCMGNDSPNVKDLWWVYCMARSVEWVM